MQIEGSWPVPGALGMFAYLLPVSLVEAAARSVYGCVPCTLSSPGPQQRLSKGLEKDQ